MEGKEDFDEYMERMEFYFTANKITNDNEKKATFLSCVGKESYHLIRGLCLPGKVSDKTLPEITKLLKKHLHPEPNIIVERYRFNCRNRKEGESVAEYVAHLRQLSQHCKFDAVLDDMLRDRICCGINNAAIQQKLFAEGNTLTFDKCYKLAISMEAATKNAQHVAQTPQQRINKVGMQNRKEDAKDGCYRCGANHNPDTCFYKSRECFYCKSIGHAAKCVERRKRIGRMVNQRTASNS